MSQLLSDQQVIERIFHHIDNQSADEGELLWRERTKNYVSQSRFQAERQLLRRLPVAFCPSSVLANVGGTTLPERPRAFLFWSYAGKMVWCVLFVTPADTAVCR